MHIESLTANDLDRVKALQPSDWNDILPMHQFYLDSDFCYPKKIMVDGIVAGIGTAVIHPDAAWLAHIIVAPEFRGRGLGKYITAALVELAKSKSSDTIWLLATPMGEPVYSRLGFVKEMEHHFFKGGQILPEWSNNENIIPFDPQYKTWLFELDKQASGEDRSHRLELVLQDANLYVKNGIAQGFYLPSFFEGLVMANTHEAGLALLQFRLTQKPVAILPINNTIATQFLHLQGFQVFRQAWRMRLGKERVHNQTLCYNRVSGQIG